MNSPSESESEMELEELDVSAIEVPAHEPCTCKSSCQTKSTQKRRGCPCRTDGRKCSSHCKCGNARKPCRNKVEIPLPIAVAQARDTEEQERQKENDDVKKFIEGLDEENVRKLAILSLQRGIGSMEFVHTLLIQECPRSESASEHDNEEQAHPAAHPQSARPGPVPDWCKCSNCRSMPQAVENKCCGDKYCITTKRRFQKLVLDAEVLELAIKNTGDIRNDREDNSTRAFRRHAYRQYILDRYNYLGKGNRRVAPSCVVLSIRNQYPSPTGVYMGFRPH